MSEELLRAVDDAAIKLLERATTESDNVSLTERVKAFDAVVAWAKTHLKPATKDAPKANGKFRNLRSDFHASGPRGRATRPPHLHAVTDDEGGDAGA